MDDTTRRSFIVKGTAPVGALAMTKATPGASAGTDLIFRMTWFNEPASSKRVGEKLIVHSRPPALTAPASRLSSITSVCLWRKSRSV